MAFTPRVKAFMLCDQTIHGRDGKHSVIGIFQRINAGNFPVFHHRFGIYLRLGEMRGDYTLKIRFIDTENDRPLAEMELRDISHGNPLDDFETSLNLPGIEIPRPGTYEIQVLANNELIHVDTLRSDKVDQNDAGRPQRDGEELDEDQGPF